jgi:glucose/mannose-6-phosphate isomerase
MEIASTDIKNFILKFPQQLKEGALSAQNLKIDGQFESLLVCGMGGSAWPAEMVRDWLNPAFPFWVNKTYALPPQINKKTLVIICSYSGNTEESLSCYNQAKERGLTIIGLTTGGQLKEMCQQDKIPFVLIPNNVPAPRLGCGYTFSALIKILSNVNLIENKDEELMVAAENIKAIKNESVGKKLAAKIAGKIPVIYTTDRLKTLSYIWKIKLNETSKIPAFANYFPEMNHNDFSAYAQKSNLMAIILRDNEEIEPIQKRMSLTAKMIEEKDMPVEFIDLKGKTLLEKIINSIILADWASYYLALENAVDPFSIKMQEDIKKELKK